jgi:Transposase IS66 family
MRLKQLPRLFADETTAPVLDPGRGRTKTGQLWAYAADDRPWGGSDPPGVAYVYAPDRKSERPIAHLEGFKGILQVDGFAGSRKLADRGDVRLAFCWSHVRRNFYELPTPVRRRSRARRSNISQHSKPSRKTSVAAVPTNAVPSGSKKAGPDTGPRADWRGTCLRYLKANLVRPILNLKFVAVTYMDYSVSHLTPRQF